MKQFTIGFLSAIILMLIIAAMGYRPYMNGLARANAKAIFDERGFISCYSDGSAYAQDIDVDGLSLKEFSDAIQHWCRVKRPHV